MQFYPVPVTLACHRGIPLSDRPVFTYLANTAQWEAFTERHRGLRRRSQRMAMAGMIDAAEAAAVTDADREALAKRRETFEREFAGVEPIGDGDTATEYYASVLGDVLRGVEYRDMGTGKRVKSEWPSSTEGRVAWLKELSPPVAIAFLIDAIASQRYEADEIPKS